MNTWMSVSVLVTYDVVELNGISQFVHSFQFFLLTNWAIYIQHIVLRARLLNKIIEVYSRRTNNKCCSSRLHYYSIYNYSITFFTSSQDKYQRSKYEDFFFARDSFILLDVCITQRNIHLSVSTRSHTFIKAGSRGGFTISDAKPKNWLNLPWLGVTCAQARCRYG